jgi:hypothetical protein
MAVKQSSTRHQPAKQAANIARLRRTGLTKSQAGKPGKKPGGSAYALLRKFGNVLTGNAKVIKAPPEVVKKYKGTFTTARNHIVVPQSPGEKTTLSRRGVIAKSKTVVRGEKPIKLYIPPSINTIQHLPHGPGIRYRVNYGTSRVLFSDVHQLEEFLNHYDKGHKFNIGFIEVIPPGGFRTSDEEEDGDDE